MSVSSPRPNLQMTASSGSDFKKTAITRMPQQYIELKTRDVSGTWPSTRGGKRNEAAAPGWNLSTSLPTSCQDSSSLSSQNSLSQLLFLRRRSHLILPSQRSRPFLHPGKVPTQWNTDSSFVLDNVHLGLVRSHRPPSGVSTGVFTALEKNLDTASAPLHRSEVRAFVSVGLKQKCLLVGTELEFFVRIQGAHCLSSVRHEAFCLMLSAY